jgi:hypothetical protein
VRRRIAIPCLLLAWLCANGALLDAVQVFAWSRMFAGYAETMPLAAALRTTLDPEKPCELCRDVAQARDDFAQKSTSVPAERLGPKIVLALPPAAVVLIGDPPCGWPDYPAVRASVREDRVPVPPPRAAA